MTNPTSPSLCNAFPFLCSPIGILVITIPVLILLHIAVLGICYRLGREFRDATDRRALWRPYEDYLRNGRLELPRQTPTPSLAASTPSIRMVDMHGMATRVTGSREEPAPEYIDHYRSPTPGAGPTSGSPAGTIGIASNPLQIPPNAYLPPSTHFRPSSRQLIISNIQLQQTLDHRQRVDDVEADFEERQAILMQVAQTENEAARFGSNPGSGSCSRSSSRCSSSASRPDSVVDFESSVRSSSSRTTPSPEPGPSDSTIFKAAVSPSSDRGCPETSHGGISAYLWKAVQKEWKSRESLGNGLEASFSASSMLLAVEAFVNWTIRYFTAA